jgi:hypothetical protein
MKKETKITQLEIDGRYNFEHDSTQLIYLGYNYSGNGHWHQFAKVGTCDVWAEVLDSELYMIVQTEKCIEAEVKRKVSKNKAKSLRKKGISVRKVQ